MKVVYEGTPLGVVGAVGADKAEQFLAVQSQLDELVLRIGEPLMPYAKAFRGKVSVEERIGELAPEVLSPATGAKKRDSLCIAELRSTVLDHRVALLTDWRFRCAQQR